MFFPSLTLEPAIGQQVLFISTPESSTEPISEQGTQRIVVEFLASFIKSITKLRCLFPMNTHDFSKATLLTRLPNSVLHCNDFQEMAVYSLEIVSSSEGVCVGGVPSHSIFWGSQELYRIKSKLEAREIYLSISRWMIE